MIMQRRAIAASNMQPVMNRRSTHWPGLSRRQWTHAITTAEPPKTPIQMKDQGGVIACLDQEGVRSTIVEFKVWTSFDTSVTIVPVRCVATSASMSGGGDLQRSREVLL
jgi:hypothetical protein